VDKFQLNMQESDFFLQTSNICGLLLLEIHILNRCKFTKVYCRRNQVKGLLPEKQEELTQLHALIFTYFVKVF